MARTRRLKLTGEGEAHYHLMSRTANKRFLFGSAETKSDLVTTMKRVAAFCGMLVHVGLAMSNHFHVVVTVTRTKEPIPEEELIARVRILKGALYADELAAHWKALARAGLDEALQREQDQLRARMNDISQFMKTFKEEFNRIFKRKHPYVGSIWSGRFTSTLIEGDDYLRTCIDYVRHNPVRAKMVSDANDYAWTFGENAHECNAGVGTVPADEFESESEFESARVGTVPANEFESESEFESARVGTVPASESARVGTVPASESAGAATVPASEVLARVGTVPASESARVGTVPASEVSTSMGTVPAWCRKRIVQFGAGKVLGSPAFIHRIEATLGALLYTRGMQMHVVAGVGNAFSSHGWRLALKGLKGRKGRKKAA